MGDIVMCKQKRIKDIFCIISEDVINMAENKEVDTIVNSANPSLMQGNGMDMYVHKAINKGLKKTDFNYQIRKFLDEDGLREENVTRCLEGEAVRTPGFELCKNVIHTVGPYYDKSNSSTWKLEQCYNSVLDIAFSCPSVRKIAIPVISARSKDFKYDEAVKIAIISINNYLIKLKQRSPHKLNDIEKVYLVIYNRDAKEYQKKYDKIIEKEKTKHYRSCMEAQISYLYEVYLYDKKQRGCYGLAKGFRYFLILIRFLYLPSMLLRSFIRRAGRVWGKWLIDIETLFQSVIVGLAFVILNNHDVGCVRKLLIGLVTYVLVDIITYLLGLVFLADIQRPSANVIRSVFLIGVNYVSSILCIAFYHYAMFPFEGEWAAFDFAILGNANFIAVNAWQHLLMYLQMGIEFFFMTLIFAFFMGHLKQRKYG